MFPCRYIKGSEISHSKLADLVGAERVYEFLTWILEENLDYERFKYMACGSLPNHKVTRPLVIVLDDDNDLEALKIRPLGEIHPSILRLQIVLDGPEVWERSD
ncbi:hypothetical protein AGABI1DRAFT_101482 [Agaricus bisporus var. burnettii JB137-S8]|uniref:Uncharacterized protein n=1 Tax=Agaricus bisporus var. burnettii (strain JB137-S8 / ATCC MYA-4627 / FGSC 10392) TaxID=597362 RepID=K5VTG5_AGABU|nr:uncharacterized protein AGABI1DRAFT_101482 [Agaricus bisporus var. burnettii JB137-S8]EKM77754.1 hypothetical protein AGABI1DRAFT_101482 [Agaricus bisporus var. burnettii JB137-S8]